VASIGLGLGLGVKGRRANSFNISSVSGLTLYTRAVTTGLTDADPAGSLVNAGSAGGTLVQATGSLKPVYRANGISSGKPALDYDGVDDFFSSSLAMSSIFSSGGWTAFSVINLDGIAAENAANPWLNAPCWVDRGGGFLSLGVGSVAGTPNAIVWVWTASAQIVRAPMPAVGTPCLLEARYTGTQLKLRVNGGTEVSLTCGNASNLTFSIGMGRYGGGANAFHGRKDVDAIWNRSLTTDELTYIRTGLAAEAGVTLA
jgi:hypothetical protein